MIFNKIFNFVFNSTYSCLFFSLSEQIRNAPFLTHDIMTSFLTHDIVLILIHYTFVVHKITIQLKKRDRVTGRYDATYTIQHFCQKSFHPSSIPLKKSKSSTCSPRFLTIIILSNKLLSCVHVLLSSSSSSCRAASTDIPDPLSPLFPIVHHLWKVFRATYRILT